MGRTAAAGKGRKARLLTKAERRHILERLRSADMSVFTAFVEKHMEENEAVQLSFYEERYRLWCAWKETGKFAGAPHPRR